MLHKAELYYGRMKMIFKLPVILSQAALSILNSNFDSDTMKNINIIFNILTGVVLSIGTVLQYESKQQEFCSAKRKFIKLSTEIEGKLLSNVELDPSYVNSLIERYNNIEESLDYDIPSFILKSTRAKWKGIKTLPLIINGVEKKEEYRNDALSLKGSPLAIIPENKQLDIEKRITDL
jgi:hypothetical protein